MAEQTYKDAFNDELDGFKRRVKKRAQARIEEAMKQVEEASAALIKETVSRCFLTSHGFRACCRRSDSNGWDQEASIQSKCLSLCRRSVFRLVVKH